MGRGPGSGLSVQQMVIDSVLRMLPLKSHLCTAGSGLVAAVWVLMNCCGKPQSGGADSVPPHYDGFIVFSPALPLKLSAEKGWKGRAE